MVEWSITAVLKTAALRGAGGSNPSLSAEKQNKADFSMKSAFFVYKSQKRNLLQINYKAVKKQEKQAMSEGSNRSDTDKKQCFSLRPLEKLLKKVA